MMPPPNGVKAVAEKVVRADSDSKAARAGKVARLADVAAKVVAAGKADAAAKVVALVKAVNPAKRHSRWHRCLFVASIETRIVRSTLVNLQPH